MVWPNPPKVETGLTSGFVSFLLPNAKGPVEGWLGCPNGPEVEVLEVPNVNPLDDFTSPLISMPPPRVGLSSIRISCSFCGGVTGRAGADEPNMKGFDTSAPLLPVDGPPKRVVGAETAGVVGVPNENAGLLSTGVVTGGVAGATPNENGVFAGVAGGGTDAAVEAKVNPPVPPVDVDGKSGLGASTVGVDGVPKEKAGLGASVTLLDWLAPKGEGDDVGGGPKSDDFAGSLAPNNGLASGAFATSGFG